MKPIEAYGKLEIINSRFIYSDEIIGERLPPEFIEKLDRAAATFVPERDFLILGGDHVQFVYFAAVLRSRYGQFRVLRWDRPAQGYVPVCI